MNFYKKIETRPYGTQYGMWMKMEGLPPAFNGELPVAIFGNEDECDRYQKEWTPIELGTLMHLEAELWGTTDVAHKKRVSGQIEKLKAAVQLRTGIVDS